MRSGPVEALQGRPPPAGRGADRVRRGRLLAPPEHASSAVRSTRRRSRRGAVAPRMRYTRGRASGPFPPTGVVGLEGLQSPFVVGELVLQRLLVLRVDLDVAVGRRSLSVQ